MNGPFIKCLESSLSEVARFWPLTSNHGFNVFPLLFFFKSLICASCRSQNWTNKVKLVTETRFLERSPPFLFLLQ